MGHRLQKIGGALVAVFQIADPDRPSRHSGRGRRWPEVVAVDAIVDHDQSFGAHLEVVANGPCRSMADCHDARHAPGYETLHPNGVEQGLTQLPAKAGRRIEAAPPVDGQRMMNGCHHRYAQCLHGQQAPTEGLVVVDHVEPVPAQ